MSVAIPGEFQVLNLFTSSDLSATVPDPNLCTNLASAATKIGDLLLIKDLTSPFTFPHFPLSS